MNKEKGRRKSEHINKERCRKKSDHMKKEKGRKKGEHMNKGRGRRKSEHMNKGVFVNTMKDLTSLKSLALGPVRGTLTKMLFCCFSPPDTKVTSTW